MNLGVAEARLSLDIADFMANAGTAEGQMHRLEGSAGRTGSGMARLGGGLLNLGTALIAPMAIGLKTAVDLEQSMANVNAALGGIDTSQLEALQGVFEDIGSASAFSAVEVAAIGESLVKAGFDIESVMSGSTQAVVDLAQATGDGLDPALTAVISTMSVWSEEVVGAERAMTDAAAVADIFTVAANESAAGIVDINAGMRSLGPVAAMMGIGVEESAAAIALFTNYGLKGADAGISLARGLQNLADPTSEASTLMNELGIAAFDLEGNFVGFPALFDQLQTGMSGMAQDAQLAALATIFGAEAMDVMGLAILSGADPLEAMIELMGESGAAAEQSAIRMNTLGAQFGELKESIGVFLGSLVSGLLPGMRLFVDSANMAVDALSRIPGPIKTVVGALAGMLAGVAAVTRAFQAWRAINTLLGGAGAAGGLFGLGPVVPLLLGVAAAAGIVYAAIRTNFLGIGEAVRVGVEAFEFFDQAGTKVGATLKAIAAALRSFDVGFLDAIADGFDAVGFSIDAFWNKFTGRGASTTDKVMESISGHARLLEDGVTWNVETEEGEKVGEIIDSWENADGTVDVVIETEGGEQVTTTIDMVTGFVEGEYETEVTIDGEDARDTIARIVDGLDGMTASLEKSAFPALARFPRAAAGVLRSADRLTESFRYYRRMGLDPVNAGLAAIGREFPQFADEAQAVQRVVNDVTTSFQDFREQGVGPVSAALLAVGDTFPSVERAMQGLAGVTTNLGDAFQAAMRGDWSQAFEELGQAARSAWVVVQEILGGIGGLVVDLFDWTINTGIPAITGWIADNAGDIGRAILTAAGWVWDTIIVPIGSITLQVAGWLVESADSVWESIKAWVLGKGSGVGGAGGAFGGAAARAAGGSIPIGPVAVMISGWIVDAAQSVWDAIRNFVIGGGSASGGISDAERRSGVPMSTGIRVGDIPVHITSWAQGTIDDISDDIEGWVTNPVVTIEQASASISAWVVSDTNESDLATQIELAVGTVVVSGVKAGLSAIEWVIEDLDLQSLHTALYAVLVGSVVLATLPVSVPVALTLGAVVGLAGLGIFLARAVYVWATANPIDAVEMLVDIAVLVNKITATVPSKERITEMLVNAMFGATGSSVRIDLGDDAQQVEIAVGNATVTPPSSENITLEGPIQVSGGTVEVTPDTININIEGMEGPPAPEDWGNEFTGAGLADQLKQAFQADLDANPIDLRITFGELTAGRPGEAAGVAGAGGLFGSLVAQAQTSLQTITTAVTTHSQAWGTILGASGAGIGAALSLAFSTALTAAQTSLQTITTAVTTHSSAWATIVGAQGSAMAAAASAATAAMLGAIQTGFQSATTAVTTHAQAWAVIVAAQGASMAASAAAAAAAVSASLAAGMAAATAAVQANASRWPGIIAATGGAMAAAGRAAGAAAGQGVAAGLLSTLGQVQSAANQIIATVDTALRSAAQIASPSKLTAYIGQMLGMGMYGGMLATLPMLSSAAGAMTSAATPYLPATGAMGGGSSHTSINAPVSVNATINGGDGWSEADQQAFAHKFAAAIRDGVEIEYTSQGAR